LLSASKPRRRRASPEHDAQVQLFRDHIEPRLIAGAVAFAIPNGGHRHKRVAEELRAEGVVAGVPDICVVYRARVYFLEMKALRGTLRKHQREMIARLEAAGATCAVARGLDAAVAQLEAWQLLTHQQMERAA
jgi:hypothetical protein